MKQHLVLLWAASGAIAAGYRSLQEGQFDLLGDEFFLDFGDFEVNTELAQENCETEYELLMVCMNMECRDFTTLCPSNNDGGEIPEEPATCESIDAIICDTFDVEGCCMNPCAFELQVLALCVGERDLECGEPSCNINETKPIMECTLSRNGERFACVHRDNITASDGEVIKTVESTFTCEYDELLGMNVSASDCECASVMTNTEDETEQVCACALCSEAASEVVSIDCMNNFEDPFIVGECTNQTCSGQCLNNETADATSPTSPPTTEEQASVPSGVPSVMPSSKPKLTRPPTERPTRRPRPPTGSPTRRPAAAGETMAPTTTTEPSSPPSQTPTADPFVVPFDPSTNQSQIPSVAPTTSTAPTMVPSTSAFPTYVNVSDSRNITTLPPDNNSTVNKTATAAPNTSSESKWYNHDAFVTFVGAFFCLCGLLCMLVTSKTSTMGKGEYNNDELRKANGTITTPLSPW